MTQLKLERQGYCVVGQHWVPRASLRKMPHDMLMMAGENRLTYADWNTAGWATTMTSPDPEWLMLHYPSLGGDGMARAIVHEDNSITYVNMAQSWVGTQTIRTTINANFVDATNVCFWIEQGVHQRESTITHNVAMGTCDEGGTNKQEWYNQTVTGSGRRWFSVPLSSVTSLAPGNICFYVTLTDSDPSNGSEWWAQWAGAADLEKPNNIYYKSVGAPISYPTDSVQRVVQDTCPKCREKVFAYRNLRGKARRETDPVIPPSTWES